MARGTVVIDEARCKGCNLCVVNCPQHVLALATDLINAEGYRPAHLVEDDSLCTGCGICALVCPDVCITVYREVISRHAPRTQPAV